MPSSCSMISGGKSKSLKSKSSKSKSSKSKSRKMMKGGSGLEAAIVPFSLLAIQQWFGTRSRTSNKTRKNRK